MKFISRMKGRASVVAGIVIVLVVLTSNAGFVRLVASSSQTTSWHLLQIAHKLSTLMRPCDVAAFYDAGVIGYFAEHRVIKFDGLVNSYAYLNEYLRPAKFLEYFEKENVTVFLLREQHARNRA